MEQRNGSATCGGVVVATGLAAWMIACSAHAADPPHADDHITRVTLHVEGTGHEVFARLARQAGVSLNWLGKDDGPRRRFDADGEAFWLAVLRACDAYGVHVVTDDETARWLTIGGGVVPTRIVSEGQGPVTVIAQDPVAVVRPDDFADPPANEVAIRVTACIDPATKGSLQAFSSGIKVTEATDGAGDAADTLFPTPGWAEALTAQRQLVQRVETRLVRLTPDVRKIARLRGTVWFILVRGSDVVRFEFKDQAEPAAKAAGGATMKVSLVADPPAGRRDVRVHVDRGTLSEGAWALVRSQAWSSMDVSVTDQRGRALERHAAIHIEDLAGWHATSKELDGVFRFDAAKGTEVSRVDVRMTTDALLVEVPVRLENVDLPVAK